MKRLLAISFITLVVSVFFYLHARHLKYLMRKEKVKFEKEKLEFLNYKQESYIYEYSPFIDSSNAAITFGRSSAYASVSKSSTDIPNDKLFYYSFIMALKFDDFRAYRDLDNIFRKYYESTFSQYRDTPDNFKYFCNYIYLKMLETDEITPDLTNFPEFFNDDIQDEKGIRHSNYFLEKMKVKE